MDMCYDELIYLLESINANDKELMYLVGKYQIDLL